MVWLGGGMGSEDAHSGTRGLHSVSLAMGPGKGSWMAGMLSSLHVTLQGRVLHSHYAGTQRVEPGI